MKIYITLLACLCGAFLAAAQEMPSFKYGKIKPEDLERKGYAIDSNASAVVLADIGSAEIEGNTKGWFSVIYKYHKRVHILNKNGYYQADIEIPLYSANGMEVELENLRAVTYNLENGKIVETKLEKSNVFKEKIDKNHSKRKFTLPNVKEGSIIEFEYKVSSDFLQVLRPWAFQGSAPRLWSEFRFTVPQFFNYAFLSQGYHAFYARDKKDRTQHFSIREDNGASRSQNYSFSSGVTEYRWAMKDVPELKKESFTSTLDNHIAKIEFQLSAFQHPLTPRNIMGTWPGLTKELLASEYFGSTLKNNNSWLSDVVKPLISNAKDDLEKAKKIYAYVRDNTTCTDYSAVYMDQNLRNVLKSKNGNVAEINLLLTAMLRYAGLNADPVILSTSGHGYTYAMYPLINRFNYVICQAEINGVAYTLDASHARLGFGKLTPDCYNGHARVVNEMATPLDLVADSLKERKMTSVFITNDDKGRWVGSMKQNSGYYESYHIREKVKDKGEDGLFKDIKKAYGVDIEIEKPAIDSLHHYEQPVFMQYQFVLNKENEDILYINPMFGEGYKENPFKSEERLYPVEMPYTFDETYVLSMQVPIGYEVDELPKQIALKLNEEGDGYFEYLISQSGTTVSLRSRLRLNRAFYDPEEYDFLREFFKIVVSKHNEQIVFKKKK